MKKNKFAVQNLFPNFSNRVFIIAEIGINHEGCLDNCIKMIDQATKSGADAVKLQTINADKNYCRESESYRIFKNSSFTKNQTTKIFNYCKKKKIKIFTTVGDIESLLWVNNLEPFAFKISSGLFNNFSIIKKILSFRKPTLVSTGVANRRDLNMFKSLLIGKKKVSLLHCVSKYPTKEDEVNLANIQSLKDQFKIPIGYSDHTTGLKIPILSILTGAVIIEKHFTLTKTAEGYDHKISLEPSRFSQMVKEIRKMEKIYHSPRTELIKENARKILSRCLVADVDLKKDQILTKANVSIKRPINEKFRGCEPLELEVIVGKKVKCDVKKDYPINLEDLYEEN